MSIANILQGQSSAEIMNKSQEFSIKVLINKAIPMVLGFD